jgi:shikimate kinase
MHIFLIGYMGSGKSAVGRELAARLGRPFTDSDHWIESRTGKSIGTIFGEDGEQVFRLLERRFVKQLPEDVSEVISCGGGLPCYNNLIDELKEKGKVVYLQASVPTLIEHLKNERERRPLLKDVPEAALAQTIADRLEERDLIYRMAHTMIATDGKNVEEIVKEIEEQLKPEILKNG